MAKRKTKNKSFASNRAAEAKAAQRSEAVQTSLRNGVVGLIGIALVGVAAYFLIQFFNAPPAEPVVIETERPLADLDPAERNGFYSAPPEMMIDTSKSYQALLVTDQGEMLIDLFDDQAPITVNNFVFLATEGFYDGLNFHRVIEDFMVQGGDPTGTGSGGPGYSFGDEFDPGLRFDRRGLLAMANSGPSTNGSQFFITHVPTDWLNDAHTIFGEVVEGDDTLGAIPISGEPGSPAKLIRIDILES